MTTFQNAFISYGRADSKAFASQLNQRLMAAGLTVWFDFEDIPLGVDYQKQIDDGIEKADNFLFLISPHSINSPYCGLEVELALQRGKRIIPLLHVEEISRETWQQRNPGGTDEQWTEYRSAGKHSSFPNMRPAISKINWVYFREGPDDFEAGLQGLLEIFERQQGYVRQHTQLLAAALEWAAHQRRSQFLLTGQVRQQAEEWLQIRFKEEQPPCLPTDLHCEYITESIKNAHNLMTQVFLAHADADAEVMAQIRRGLQREGITVWTSTTDIRLGEDFQQAIHRGIEQADNLVYLLSPAAQASEFCQQELDYALSLNKRLIPILVSKTDEDTIPHALRGLQYIEWLSSEKTEHQSITNRSLLKVLKEDAAYFNEHKVLLTQALKWERQQRNPTILLRGYNLHHAEAWLKAAQTRSRHQPTALQTEFLQESLRQPPAQSLDVFISYSRVDSDFARKLNDRLQMQGKRTWFDQESIASGTDFQQEIYRGIETSDHFLFILSPEAVNSPYCDDEVEYAQQLNKRVVTVLHRAINTSDLHPVLAAVQWIDFRKFDGDFNANFRELLRTLESDRAHLEAHTKLLVKALEWEKKNHSKDLLLRGQELEAVIEWLTQNAEKEPRSSQIQRDYINASRLEATAQQQAKLEHEATVRRRITRALIAAVGGLVVAIGLGATTFQQFRRAEAQRQDAVQSEIEARVSSANALLESDQPLDALIESLRAINQLQNLGDGASTMTYQVAGTLYQAIADTHEINRLSEHAHWVHAVAFSPTQDVFATAGRDGTVRIWQQQGQLVTTVEGRQGESSNALNFSPDGKILAVAINNSVKLLDLEGNLIGWIPGHSDSITQVSFSPDGQLLATAARDGTIALWNRRGNLLQLIQGHSSIVYDVQFSPDGKTLASGGVDTLIKLWNYNGDLLNTLSGHAGTVSSVAFSSDGLTLVSASFDGNIKLWNQAGDLLETFKITPSSILTKVRFSPDEKTLVIATGEQDVFRTSVKLWSLKGQEIQQFTGHGSRITDASFSPDGKFIVSTSFDGTVRLWQLENTEAVATLKGHDEAVSALSFSADGQTLASSSRDRKIILWDAEGQILSTLTDHSDAVNTVVFSSDRENLLSASDDHTIKVWNSDGELQTTLKEHKAQVENLSISPDGKFWASVSSDGNVKLWTSAGKIFKELTVDEGFADMIRFHPKEPVLAIAVGRFNQDSRNVLLWNWQQETITPLNPTGSFAVRDMQFNSADDSLAVASWHGNLTFWNLAGEKLNSFFAGYAGPVNSMQLSPDGNTVAVGSQSLMLFNLEGDLLQMLQPPKQTEISSLAFTPDGQKLFAGQMDGSIAIWNLSASDLIEQGCQRLEDYLISHPEILIELDLCQTPTRLARAANVWIKQGAALARQGNEAEALEIFKQATNWNPELDLNPVKMVATFTSEGKISQLIAEGDRLARQGDSAGAIKKFKAAKDLDETLTFDSSNRAAQEKLKIDIFTLLKEGREQASQNELEAAMDKFKAAKTLEPDLAIDPNFLARNLVANSLVDEALGLINQGQIGDTLDKLAQAKEINPSLSIHFETLSHLCRQGSIEGYATSVLDFCDQAVAKAASNATTRTNRGLARALSGNVEGAITDFQFFVNQTPNEEAKREHQEWITALTEGENPFTEEVLSQLQDLN